MAHQQGFASKPETPQPQQNNPQIDPKALQQPRKRPSRFSAPVPGESLTSTPQNMVFEKPPQFTDLETATEFIWEQLNKRGSMLKLLAMLDKQVPVDGIVKTILFSGFASGKWTPDLAILMAKPIIAMVMAIGRGAGIKLRNKTEKKSKGQKDLETIINIDTGKVNG
jgi:hypothetical protein